MAANIITVYVCNGSIARDAFYIGGGFAMATVLKLLDFIASSTIAIPFINDSVIIYCLIPAVLPFLLFTGKGYDSDNGKGNGKFFHIHKILIKS